MSNPHAPPALGDLLDHGAVPSPESASPVAPAAAIADGVIPRIEEMLAAGDVLEGGFLTFDSDSSPGNTIVRVVLDGAETPQVFDVATFRGVDLDLNGLLGLAADGTQPG